MFNEYPNFAALLAARKEGIDFDRKVRLLPEAKVAVLAPHGGRIEPCTDLIAEAIAANDFSLYCFRSHRSKAEANLHITSHNFDDPKCLSLAGKHQWVVTIHGCNKKGQRVLLGGRDAALVADLASRLKAVGISAETSGHKYLGTDPKNICNRSATAIGVQFELSMSFRRGQSRTLFVEAVRAVLITRQNAT